MTLEQDLPRLFDELADAHLVGHPPVLDAMTSRKEPGDKSLHDKSLHEVGYSTRREVALAPPPDRRTGRRWLGTAAAALVTSAVGAVFVAETRGSDEVTPADLATLPPMADDLPSTGKAWLPETELAVSMAAEVLRMDCYQDAGYDVQGRTRADWITFGQWQAHPVLGIRRAGAARTLGYTNQFADSSTDIDSDVIDSCRQQVNRQFDGQYLAIAEPLRGTIENQLQDRADLAAQQDPRVRAALDTWSNCISSATDITATTPNDLARQFKFGEADQDDIPVAVADVECQASAELETTWYTVVTEYERAMIGDDIDAYDTLVRVRSDFIDDARSLLSERGVAIPSLD